MRIDVHCGAQVPGNEAANRAQSNALAAHANTSSKIGQDETVFSGGHVQLQALAAQAEQLPEIRQQKVEALREAITSGRYRAKPVEVAVALMDEMRMARSA